MRKTYNIRNSETVYERYDYPDGSFIDAYMGPVHKTDETETDVTILIWNPKEEKYDLKETFKKVIDDPETPEVDEELGFWEKVRQRLLFWRTE